MLCCCLLQLCQVVLRCCSNAAGGGCCSYSLLLHLLRRLPLTPCRLPQEALPLVQTLQAHHCYSSRQVLQQCSLLVQASLPLICLLSQQQLLLLQPQSLLLLLVLLEHLLRIGSW
jgi:hypothetical protein